jgi:sterol desaturase/sphingolipid hydroxylase (fatty acid hydroxylase superfamily)
MKNVHYKHHQALAPTGLTAEYAHPVEEIFCNTVTTFIGPCLLPGHGAVVVVFLALRIWNTVEAHSGYDLPWSVFKLQPMNGGARRHDYHHSHYDGNYGGIFSFWDKVMGTDKWAKKSQINRK